jgi:capsular exopolysaccharide synthesis family protein
MSDNITQPGEPREAHLLDYWHTIWRGRWTVLTIFVVVLVLVAIGTFTQTPIFRATATVEITPQSRKVSPVADVAELGSGSYGWYAEERYFNTQYEIIKSRDVAQRAFDRLDLYNHPQFKRSQDPVGSLIGMLDVEAVKETGIVQISLEGRKPEEVATWVNTVAEAYVERNLDQAVQATSSAVNALLHEIAPLKERLEDTQRDSFEFAEKANLYIPENQKQMTNERLSRLQTQLTETQVKRSEYETLINQLDGVVRSGGAYESIPQIGNDPVVQGLYREKVVLEREYDRLRLTYKDKHIRVQEKQEELQKLNEKILAEANRIVSNLKTELTLLKDQEGRLRRAIDETRTESLLVNRKSTTYELVRGEATETKRIYDLITARVKEIGLSASLLSNNLRILDRSPVPKFPVKPRPVLNLAIGVLMGLLLGVGTVFFVDYLDNTVRSTEDVERYLRLNLLAIVPRAGEDTDHAVREAYQSLRTSLLFSRKNRHANAVLITSSGPREGKTMTIVSVARTLAIAGERVAIIDCDLRRPAVHQRLGLSRDLGVTNYILASQGDDWRDYMLPTDQPNLQVMASGPLPPNPADVFGHERFKNLLVELRQHFDWVFVDSPPVVSLADAVILATLTDMVAFVIKHNENDKDLILRCVTDLRKVNANVIGAVLNHVDLEKSHYKDYYYVGYYYYGDSETKGPKRRSRESKLAAVQPAADPSADTRTRTAG